MIQEKELILRVHSVFTKKINKTLTTQSGIVNQYQLNAAIEKALRCEEMTTNQYYICEGFYDAYTGLWGGYGREVAEGFYVALKRDQLC